MNLANLLVRSARSFPEKPAVSIGARGLFSYRTLGERAAALSSSMRRLIARGDRVALAMHNCPEYLEVLFACWHGGFAAAPMNARLNEQELAFMIEDCGAKLVFASEDIASRIAPLLPGAIIFSPGSSDYRKLLLEEGGAPAETKETDLAWIFYTSGTTGKPKGAMLSHGNLFAMLVAYFADVDFIDERDCLLHLAATSHASGLFALSHIAKASNNILPESRGYSSAEFSEIVARSDNLTFFAVSTLLRRMCGDAALRSADLSRIKTVIVGAAPVYAADLHMGLEVFGPKLWNGYGQGESPCTITAMSKKMIAEAARVGDEERLVSVGVARTGVEVRLEEGGRLLPPGEIGEVLVRGPTVMMGYWNRPDATAETLENGWLRTGDLGRMDGDGFLWLLDRKKDLIISGGMNIYAREVEEALLHDPSVDEVAVIGLPDEDWGESVVAVIVLKAGASADPAALDRLCLHKIARFKRPKRYDFMAALPKNAAGKVLKKALREICARRA